MRTTKHIEITIQKPQLELYFVLTNEILYFSQPTYPHVLFSSGTNISRVELRRPISDWFMGADRLYAAV